MRISPKHLVILLAGIGLHSAALAADVSLLFNWDTEPATYADTNVGSNLSVGVHQMYNVTGQNVQIGDDVSSLATFIAYCFEPTQSLSGAVIGGTVVEDTVTYTQGLNYVAGTAIQSLFDLHYADSLTSTTNQAAFQLALWELKYDTPSGSGGGTDLTTGGFQVTGVYNPGDVTTTVTTQAAGYLDDLGSAATTHYALTNWTSAGGQDLLTATAVPEPATGLLAALGLVGLAASRRKQRAA